MAEFCLRGDFGRFGMHIEKPLGRSVFVQQLILKIDRHAVILLLQCFKQRRFAQGSGAVGFKVLPAFIPFAAQQLRHSVVGVGIGAQGVAVVSKIPQSLFVFRRFVYQLLKGVAVHGVQHKDHKIFVRGIFLQLFIARIIIAGTVAAAAQPQRDHRDQQHQRERPAAKKSCIVQPLFAGQKKHQHRSGHAQNCRGRTLAGIGIPVYSLAVQAGQAARKKTVLHIAHHQPPQQPAECQRIQLGKKFCRQRLQGHQHCRGADKQQHALPQQHAGAEPEIRTVGKIQLQRAV